METITILLLIITSILHSNGISLQNQLDHIAEAQLESQGVYNDISPSRRHFYKYDPRELSDIIGAPSRASHLPEAERVLPGHTLIKPSMGMLKSSVKFPHMDLEEGSGVYGNLDNIGIRYDSKNERVLYTGFRRMPSDYIMVAPSKPGSSPGFSVAPTVLDFDKKKRLKNDMLKILKYFHISERPTKIFVATSDDDSSKAGLQLNNKMSMYLNDNKLPRIKENTRGKIYFKKILQTSLPRALKILGVGKGRTLLPRILQQPQYYLQLPGSYQQNQASTLRRDTDDGTLVDDALDDDSGESEEDIKSVERSSEEIEHDEKGTKLDAFWSTKDLFDHVKINQNAPDYINIFTKSPKDTREWWFYNEEDYKPFTEE